MSAREKVGYGLGDMASGLLWQSITLFLMYFYTEVFGLTAVVAGTLLFVARAWDAVWDLFLGYAVDRTSTRWGRCRPYLLFGPPVLALAAVATFTVPDLQGQAKVLYAYVTYIALMMSYSLVNIPYCSMPALLSADPAERTSLSEYRLFLAFSGWLIVAATTLPLVQWLGGGDKALGYQHTLALMGLVAMFLFWCCFTMTRERVAPPIEKPNLPIEAKAIVRSRAWWALFIAGMLQFTAAVLPNSTALYFLRYVSGHADWASAYFVVANIGLLVGVLLSSQLTRRWCKRSVVMTTTLVSASCLLLLNLVDPGSRWQVYTWIFFVNVFGAVKGPIIWSMVSDTADHMELRTGRRIVGLTTSSVAFSNKFGIGVGAGLSGLLLAAFGYVAGAEQSAMAKLGLVMMMSVLPALLYACLAGVYWFYPLNRARLIDLKADLEERRNRLSSHVLGPTP